MHETPEGYLVCVGVPIARTGEMVYGRGETPLEPGEDGKVIVDRSADEVFRPETMASFEGKSVTILHPNDFVNPKNWSKLEKGTLQNIRRGQGDQKTDLIADLLIKDSEAINLVKNGLREVSCGYDSEYVQTGKGRGIQRKILGNHLALVSEGRAGSSYAINDHKGKGSDMKLADKIKAIFAKAQDEALKVAGETGDAAPAAAEEKTSGYGLDDVMKAVRDLNEKLAGTTGKEAGKDASTEPTAGAPAEVVADEEVAPGLEERLKKLEAAVATILEKMSAKVGDGEEDVDTDETGDDDGDGDDDEDDETGDDASCDDEMEKNTRTGDTASRVEILAPGMKARGKDVKAKALESAYRTVDGKAVIDQFTGGKAPDLKNEKFVNTLFIASSEILKSKRSSEFAKTKKTRDFQSGCETPPGGMTAEKMNELNAKHYGSKVTH